MVSLNKPVVDVTQDYGIAPAGQDWATLLNGAVDALNAGKVELGADLGGTTTAPTVSKIQGIPVTGAPTPTPTASRLVQRDAAGRAQFADPAAAQDAATKTYVDVRTYPVNPMTYGATGNGVTDDTTAVQTALAAAQAAKRDLWFPPGTYKMTGTLTFSPFLGGIRGVGQVILDFTGLTSGVAITAAPATSTDGATHEVPGTIENLIMHGPYMSDSFAGPYNVDALQTSSGWSSQGVEGFEIHNVRLTGFRDGFVCGNNSWDQRLVNCYIQRCRRYAINFGAFTNAYENLTLVNTMVANNQNPAGTAYAFYCPDSTNADFTMISGSVDYNSQDAYIGGGQFRFFGTHIEAQANAALTAPRFTVRSIAGGPLTMLEFHGCQIAEGPSNQFVAEYASNAANVIVTFTGCQFGQFGTAGTLIAQTAGFMLASVKGCVSGRSFSTAGVWQYGLPVNTIVNGNFEAAISTQTTVLPIGVVNAPAGITVTRDTTTFHSGAASLKVVTAGTVGTVGITVPVTGQLMQPTGYYNVTAYTAGTLNMRVQFYDSAGTPGKTVNCSGNITATTAGWLAAGNLIQVPPGAAYAQLQANLTSAPNMTVYLDDLEIVFV